MVSDYERIIFHIDVNFAFLSWSAIRLLESGSKIDLRTIPSIVGGDQKTRHGIVVAKSIPAKKYGIHTADTVASAFQKCPNLVSVKPDHSYYHKKSQELMEYLRNICPCIHSRNWPTFIKIIMSSMSFIYQYSHASSMCFFHDTF